MVLRGDLLRDALQLEAIREQYESTKGLEIEHYNQNKGQPTEVPGKTSNLIGEPGLHQEMPGVQRH